MFADARYPDSPDSSVDIYRDNRASVSEPTEKGRLLKHRSILVELVGLSFGAAAGYTERGGQSVISDDSPSSSSIDLSITGLQSPRNLAQVVMRSARL